MRLRRDGRRIGGVLLAVFLTAVLALALWWGFLRDGELVSAQGMKVEMDFSAVPPGAPPSTFDSGQPAALASSPTDPSASVTVDGGLLTYRPTVEGAVAAYLSTPDLGAPVRALGASWVFQPGQGTYGAIALIVSDDIRDEFPPTLAPISIHFVATAINWNVSVKKANGGQLEPVGAGSFAQPLVEDGETVHTAAIEIDGDTATLRLPDGRSQRVNDPRISQWRGRYATFEIYANHGLTDSMGAFKNVWADSRSDG